MAPRLTYRYSGWPFTVLTELRGWQVLMRARPTVSTKDLVTHTNFTKEFGEEG